MVNVWLARLSTTMPPDGEIEPFAPAVAVITWVGRSVRISFCQSSTATVCVWPVLVYTRVPGRMPSKMVFPLVLSAIRLLPFDAAGVIPERAVAFALMLTTIALIVYSGVFQL